MDRYSAGVLIYSYDPGGDVTFLLGEDYKNKYSDFGGRCDVRDTNHIHTASREFYEETCGVIMDVHCASHKIQKSPIIHSVSYMGNPYYMYVLYVPYCNEYVHEFQTVRKYINFKKIEKRFKEKISLKWFTIQDILDDKEQMRQIFLKTFVKNIDIIQNVTARKVFKH